MERTKFDADRAVIVRRVDDDGHFFLFTTRCGQQLRVSKERLSVEIHPEIYPETACVVLDLMLSHKNHNSIAILAAAEAPTIEKLFSDCNVPFPGLRCTLATPA